MATVQILGKCSCGREVTRELGARWTPRTNGERYFYTGKPQCEMDGQQVDYDIFRCESCGEVIDKNWRDLFPSSRQS